MKSLNFKRKENAQLRYLDEKVMGKARVPFNWDRLVYLFVLGLLLFFILRYFFLSNFYISANGQVIFDNVEISQTVDVQIERFYCEEGDDIKKGDTLFTYLVEDIRNLEMEEIGKEKSGWEEKEEYTLLKNMELNLTKIKGDQDLMAAYHTQLKQQKNEVLLGAANERDLNNLEYQISKLETQIRLITSQNEVLSSQLENLQANRLLRNKEDKKSNVEVFTPQKVYLSPIDGYVARIFKEPYEIALKSQIILKIHQADSVFIKGYFEQDDLRYVKEGDQVTVNFPDGKEGIGVIRRFYASTVILPEEFQKKYEPIKRTIAVDVTPAEGSDLSIWKRYYKLSVKLRKSTF